jgi:hypothetical protein
MPAPKYIKYWGGRFRISKEILPSEVQSNVQLQQKILLLVQHKYSHFNWGSMLPSDKLDEINTYVDTLLQTV